MGEFIFKMSTRELREQLPLIEEKAAAADNADSTWCEYYRAAVKELKQREENSFLI